MRERDLPEKLGIPTFAWPDRLPEGSLLEIIESSQEKPLRLVIARFIGGEAMSLWQSLKSNYYEALVIQERKRSANDLAINEGYARVHTMILRANSFLEDRQGEDDRQVKAVGFEKGIHETQLRETTKDARKRAVSSLESDPSGISYLEGELGRLVAVWSESDAGIIGLAQGVARYKFLYDFAVAAGAIPDKPHGTLRKLLLKLKRKK